MKYRLQEIMKEMMEMLNDIQDMRTLLMIYHEYVQKEKRCDQVESVLNIQMQTVGRITDKLENLYNKLDETILDLVHNRVS